MSGGAATALLLPSGLGAQSAGRGLQSVVERLRAFAITDLAAKGLPGMQVALVTSNDTATFGVGFSEPSKPVLPDQLFQIASITKSLTAMTIFSLAARKRLDLEATVQELLPELALPLEPIRLKHLLEHSSGLPSFLSDSPAFDVPGGRLWTGSPPGTRYSYNNLGYSLLGHVIARVTGIGFDEALRRITLQPIGMTAAVPVVRIADRARYATGHSRHREDIPWLPRARLAPARWTEFQAASGSVAATAADMVQYMRYVIRLGRGQGAPLFDDTFAERFRTPTIDYDQPGARYGNGLVHLLVDNAPVLRHTGGVVGFTSAFTVDPAAGVGIYAAVNAGGIPYRPTEINDYAIALLRAFSAGSPLPEPRMPATPSRPSAEQRSRFTGDWHSADGLSFVITDGDDGLSLVSDGVKARVGMLGTSAITDHPALAPYFITPFDREAKIMRVGDRLFERGLAPAMPPVQPHLAALSGTYYNPQPPTPYRTIHAVGDRLFAGPSELRAASDGSWRFQDSSQAAERLWFEHMAFGRPQQLLGWGIRFTRLRHG